MKTPFFWTSTGKKVLMALSGLALVGFIVGHLIGNLQIFLGPEAVNRYAAFLKSTGELLWVVRFGLLGILVLHIVTAVSLVLENRAARPVGYVQKDYVVASYASRTMHVSGLIVIAYLIYHLLHFTVRSVHPEFGHLVDAQGRHDVYSMVVLSFQQWPIVLAYLIGNGLLAMHLSHGLYSMFQSLGLQSLKLRATYQPLARLAGWGIFLGYASIPLGVYLGLVKLP